MSPQNPDAEIIYAEIQKRIKETQKSFSHPEHDRVTPGERRNPSLHPDFRRRSQVPAPLLIPGDSGDGSAAVSVAPGSGDSVDEEENRYSIAESYGSDFASFYGEDEWASTAASLSVEQNQEEQTQLEQLVDIAESNILDNHPSDTHRAPEFLDTSLRSNYDHQEPAFQTHDKTAQSAIGSRHAQRDSGSSFGDSFHLQRDRSNTTISQDTIEQEANKGDGSNHPTKVDNKDNNLSYPTSSTLPSSQVTSPTFPTPKTDPSLRRPPHAIPRKPLKRSNPVSTAGLIDANKQLLGRETTGKQEFQEYTRSKQKAQDKTRQYIMNMSSEFDDPNATPTIARDGSHVDVRSVATDDLALSAVDRNLRTRYHDQGVMNLDSMLEARGQYNVEARQNEIKKDFMEKSIRMYAEIQNEITKITNDIHLSPEQKRKKIHHQELLLEMRTKKLMVTTGYDVSEQHPNTRKKSPNHDLVRRRHRRNSRRRIRFSPTIPCTK